MLMYFFLHIVEVLNVLNLCGEGSFIPVHPSFLLQESCKQCYFSLILHIFTGAVGKKQPQFIPYIYIFLTQYLLLMFDMYRSLALLYK